MEGLYTASACHSPLSSSVSFHTPTASPATKAAPSAVVSDTLGLCDN